MSLPPILQGLRIPVIGAPLFIVSNPKLVIAQCTSGIVGSFPALNARPAELLDEWLHEITEALAAWNRDHPDGLRRPSQSTRSSTAPTTASSMTWRLREMEGADRHHLARRAGRAQRGSAPWGGSRSTT